MVIWMDDCLDLSFTDLGMIPRALTTFYTYADILVLYEEDMQQISEVLGTASLTLSAVIALEDGTEQDFAGSCLFLKPASAADALMEEVFAAAHRLAQACRCGACFDCLRTPGSVN